MTPGRKTPNIQRLLALASKGKRRSPKVRDYGDRVERLCQAHRLPIPAREYRFDRRGWDPPRYDKRGNLKLRQWKFDCAWPAAKVAVECHGGVHGERGRGRHLRLAGINADAEKSTAAQLQGWTVLVFTAEQLPSALFGTEAERLVGMLREALGVTDAPFNPHSDHRARR